MIRPQPARWFEILTPRDDATLALAALAASSSVELESRSATDLPGTLATIRPQLAEFNTLSLRYRPYWPGAELAPSAFPEAPDATLSRALERIRVWAADAEPTIIELQRHEAEATELELWRSLLTAIGGSAIDFTQLARSGPLLKARLGVFPADAVPIASPTSLMRGVTIDDAYFALMVGVDADVSQFHQQAAALKGRVHDIPVWLRRTAQESLTYIGERCAELEAAIDRSWDRLRTLNREHDLNRTIGDADRLKWIIEHVRALDSTECFALVTGWTNERDNARLRARLDHSGARCLLSFPAPPEGARAPLLLVNPWWAKPYEILSRALGMPMRDEADPTLLLALTVPFMFGYMFGDLGQGLVLAIGAFLLRNRFAIARLFIAGGLSAAVFGVLFGSVFSMEGLIHPVWLNPLEEPLAVLLVPLAFGAGLLLLGQLFSGIEAYWRGQIGDWAAVRGCELIAYLAILGGFFHAGSFIIAVVAMLGACVGGAMREQRWIAFLTTLGEAFERLAQLLVNTLSFVRIGAFALAHAGLSAAIVSMMELTDSIALRAFVLVLGNVVVLGLETLVVAVQTTRLVLFEFFTRFLAAGGRAFRPLPVPPFLAPTSP